MSLDILIVDDEEMLRKLEKRYIENFMKKNGISDYVIDTAEYGQQAVDKIKTKFCQADRSRVVGYQL